jgi:hypothetical protein
LEILAETVPTVSGISNLYDPSAMPPRIAARSKAAVISAARMKGVHLSILEI